MEKFSFNAIPNCICVYKISNTINDKVYIGSTTNLNSRIVQHRYDSINRPNNCPKFYNAINTIGSEHFYVEILETYTAINMEDLHDKESFYINKFNSIEFGYNERLDINNKCIMSIDTKTKMSISSKNTWAKGAHKNHARKLSKFRYNIYDINNKLIDEDITTKEIADKYNIPSSNILQTIKKNIIKQYGYYDETITYKLYIKHYFVERIYIGKGNGVKNDIIDESNITFDFNNK